VRGSGGVGVLISAKHYIISRDLGSRDRGHVVGEAEPGRRGRGASPCSVLYVPPESSSCGRSSEEYFQILAEQVTKFGVFGSLGPLIICGDFNARCGDLDMNVG